MQRIYARWRIAAMANDAPAWDRSDVHCIRQHMRSPIFTVRKKNPVPVFVYVPDPQPAPRIGIARVARLKALQHRDVTWQPVLDGIPMLRAWLPLAPSNIAIVALAKTPRHRGSVTLSASHGAFTVVPSNLRQPLKPALLICLLLRSPFHCERV